ncbi:hypothetical protein HOY80DRAFT_1036873 [Tuber brumale]|nr:hypothetical protein HOY80DRAFT_1036873 [Tuber brumale]
MAVSSKGFYLLSYSNMESKCVMNDLERLRSKLDTVVSGGNSHRWSQALPEIALSMNWPPYSRLGRLSPYEVMFNRKPRWEESIPIHSRLQQTLNNIPKEEPNHESHIQQTSSHDQEPEALDLETLPESRDATKNRVIRTVFEEAMQNEAEKAGARSAHKYNKQHTIEPSLARDIPTAHGLLKSNYPVNARLRVPEAAGIHISISTTLMSTDITLHAAAAMVSTSSVCYRASVAPEKVGPQHHSTPRPAHRAGPGCF